MPLDSSVFAARRAVAVARMKERGGGVLLVPAADEKIRSNDSEYVFRQHSDFYYLTGLDEPMGCLVLAADESAFITIEEVRPLWRGFYRA